MKKIGIFVGDYSTSYGVKVIVEHAKHVLTNLEVIQNVNDVDKFDMVIPYGIIQVSTLVKYGRDEKMCAFMVDALSLGMISDFARMLPYRFIPLKFKLKLLGRYFIYLYREYVCLKNYDNIMLVSAYDKKYFVKHPIFRKFAKKIIIIPNGIDLKEINIKERLVNNRSEIRIGCLSAWNDSAFYTLRIFLDEIWSKINSEGSMRLIIAGSKITPDKEAILKQYDNVEVLGFVDTLDEFFDNIDISLITFLKKCGILNKILDSFAYKVPVLGRPQNFGAFEKIPDCFYTYVDRESFKTSVEHIMEHSLEAAKKVEKAYNYVQEHHDWKKNYRKLECIINEN